MKKLHILLSLSLVLCFLSCTPIKQDDVSVKSIESVTPNGGSKIGAVLLIENKYRKDIHIDQVKVVVSNGGEPFLEGVLAEGFVIPRKGVNPVSINLAYRITNPLAMFGIVMAANSDPKFLNNITLTGQAKVKVGVLSKVILLPQTSLADALQMLESQGIDTSGLNFFKTIR